MVKAGEKAIDFTFDTIYEDGLKFSDVVKNADTTILHFLRYYGCRLCQLDIREYAKLIEKIKEKNAQLYIVLQSKKSTMEKAEEEVELPFDIILDPEQELYKLYDIGSLMDKSLVDKEKMAAFGEKFKELGLIHGEYEGNEDQLPALFIMDKDMQVKYAKYSANLTDMPSPGEVVEKLI